MNRLDSLAVGLNEARRAYEEEARRFFLEAEPCSLERFWELIQAYRAVADIELTAGRSIRHAAYTLARSLVVVRFHINFEELAEFRAGYAGVKGVASMAMAPLWLARYCDTDDRFHHIVDVVSLAGEAVFQFLASRGFKNLEQLEGILGEYLPPTLVAQLGQNHECEAGLLDALICCYPLSLEQEAIPFDDFGNTHREVQRHREEAQPPAGQPEWVVYEEYFGPVVGVSCFAPIRQR